MCACVSVCEHLHKGKHQKGLQGSTIQSLCSTDVSPKTWPTQVQCSQIPFPPCVSSFGKWNHPKDRKKQNPTRQNIFPRDVTSTRHVSMPWFVSSMLPNPPGWVSSPCLSHSLAALALLHPMWRPSVGSLDPWLWMGLVSRRVGRWPLCHPTPSLPAFQSLAVSLYLWPSNHQRPSPYRAGHLSYPVSSMDGDSFSDIHILHRPAEPPSIPSYVSLNPPSCLAAHPVLSSLNSMFSTAPQRGFSSLFAQDTCSSPRASYSLTWQAQMLTQHLLYPRQHPFTLRSSPPRNWQRSFNAPNCFPRTGPHRAKEVLLLDLSNYLQRVDIMTWVLLVSKWWKILDSIGQAWNLTA